MALQEEFQRTGNWLFRWRSYLPLFLIVLVGLSMKNYHYPFGSALYDWLWEGLCFLVGFFGMAIRAITIGHTPAKTSGRNTKAQVADKLNTSGIYSLVRNPLYLGNYFMMLGIVLFPRNIWGIVVFTLLFALYYERIIYAEEAYLRVKFGEEYLDWAAKTPAFIPRFTHFKPSRLPFSFKNVLKREYSGFFGFILSMFIVEVFGDWVISGRVHVQTGWWIILGSGFVIYLTVRTLKKNTKVFNVVGR
ncbi:MAG: isoprenylcysteine carboxylmethyltransferase family protein [Candidatus Cloacimonetes bacterium]|jgi:protein-S-isoprenylcysteine O-methyltransferase Ste14|nr:isoprenylcysteine carboxylmethyltransferase family protein [Candidatus Cloacimonadota bacterium]MDD4277967.1 isoprenylcysteine carboxylmethyltransferase family protein [Candidatus Cloacimonadota bacterium]MDY0326267.1 isoprenylcysteine carboxylmethyltransferase family protein [Candidatus Cloacimonadaceae bacterium]